MTATPGRSMCRALMASFFTTREPRLLCSRDLTRRKYLLDELGIDVHIPGPVARQWQRSQRFLSVYR
jgi:hypothetical protein